MQRKGRKGNGTPDSGICLLLTHNNATLSSLAPLRCMPPIAGHPTPCYHLPLCLCRPCGACVQQQQDSAGSQPTQRSPTDAACPQVEVPGS